MIDLMFLKALREKLKGGNIRSIHLNALPGRYATRLDFTNLDYIEPKLAEKFFEQLVSKSCFEFPISFDKIDISSIPAEEHKRLGLLSKRLNSLFIENEDNYKEHGIKTFGFGFPILIKPSRRDPTKIIKAPILIWQLELVKSTNKINTWYILRNKIRNEAGHIKDEEIHSVGLNEVLLSFLKTDENISIPQINEELLEDAIIDKEELIDECYKVLKSLNGEKSSLGKQNLFAKLQEPLASIPDSTSLESISNNRPWIYFGGIFGLYKTQKESIITDIDKIIERFAEFQFEKLKVSNFAGTVHCAVETDPSQQEILSTLGVEPKKIIQGPPGTGKSQSLTALITNALANNLKCLVVCEKKTALDVIKKNLHNENDQLGSLAAVIEDISKDRDSIVNSVRDRLSVLSQLTEYSETFYENIRQSVEGKSKSINEQHQELAKTLYQGKRWTLLVGEFLKVHRTVNFSGLNQLLDYKQFEFDNDEAELREIINYIKLAKRLFKQIKQLDHPLEILNDEIFSNEISRAAELKLKEIEKVCSSKLQTVKGQLLNDLSCYENWLDDFYQSTEEKVENLHAELNSNLNSYNNWLSNFYLSTKEAVEKLIKDLETAVNDYKQWLERHYDAYYWELKHKIREYQLFANSNVENFGKLYYNNNQLTKIKINLLSLVSKRYKELRDNRIKLIETIPDLKDIHHSLNYFEHKYPEEKNYKSLSTFVDNVNLLESNADKWYEQNIKVKEDYVNRMSSYFLHDKYEKTEEIFETETSFKKLSEHLALDEKLSLVPLENASDLLSKIEQLELMLKNLQNEKEIKEGYLKEFSSDCLHPHFNGSIEEVVIVEKDFSDFISYIRKDKQLVISGTDSNSHNLKISELQKILDQLEKKDLFKLHYKEKLSSTNINCHYENIDSLKRTESAFQQIISTLNNEKVLKQLLKKGEDHKEKIAEADILLSEMQIISQNIESFREYFEWRKFFMNLSPLNQSVIKSLIELNCDDWENTFTGWYYYWLLAIAESNLKNLPKDSYDLMELKDAKREFKVNQIRSILSKWTGQQQQSVKHLLQVGVNPVSLFNKRGGRGERRNSLRKIIKTDFRLFTDFFPVVMTSPSVCSSILPLTEGLFDLVIFDEASQLRLEDTFPALLRGKIKIVSGDSQQMPPSNYFQGGAALLNPTEEDYEEEQLELQSETSRNTLNNSLDLADSESLLVYAENCNYRHSYLKIHYRSQHPYLIDFSNHAFYGKRLIPMPAKREYKPIQFIEVNGIYEDQVNRDEARQVVDILLNHVKPFEDGKYPSVGVATFNLYQRNLILEEIIRVRQQNPDYDKKISDLGSDLFVKNLENIQGDERDIIIISTTFGKRPDGTFRQNFGPIVQGKGYKLLNVIITRAKYKIYVCCSIPQDFVRQYSSLLQKSKNTGRAIFYAYLAYAKAVSDNNHEVKDSLLHELYENCESRSYDVEDNYLGSESPFEEEVYYRLAKKIGQTRIQQQFRIGGFRIDLIIKSKITGKPLIAIECDGAKYHNSNEAWSWDMFRQSQLEKQGFIFYRIWSTNWWASEERELKKLLDFIHSVDNKERMVNPATEAEVFVEEKIVPVSLKADVKRKVSFRSVVTIRNPEGKILKVRFSKTQSTNHNKADRDGIITIYENSPLALSIIGKTEGEVCQLGMLEMYYEVLNIA